MLEKPVPHERLLFSLSSSFFSACSPRTSKPLSEYLGFSWGWKAGGKRKALQNPQTRGAGIVTTGNVSTLETEAASSRRRWADSTSKIKWKVIEEDIRSQLWASTCTHRCVHTHHKCVHTCAHCTHVGEKDMADISEVTAKYNHCHAVITSQMRLTLLRVRPAPMAMKSTEEGWYLKPLNSQWAVFICESQSKDLEEPGRLLKLVKEGVELTPLLSALEFQLDQVQPGRQKS